MFGRKREPHLLRINKKSNLMGRFFQIIQSNQFQNMGLILQWVQCAIPQENEKKGKELSEKSVEFRRSFSLESIIASTESSHWGFTFHLPMHLPFPLRSLSIPSSSHSVIVNATHFHVGGNNAQPIQSRLGSVSISVAGLPGIICFRCQV